MRSRWLGSTFSSILVLSLAASVMSPVRADEPGPRACDWDCSGFGFHNGAWPSRILESPSILLRADEVIRYAWWDVD